MYLLDESIQERSAIDFYLRHHNSNIPKSELLITAKPEYRQLLAPFFTQYSEDLFQWASADYIHQPQNPEQLIHNTPSGAKVRSKSEAMIDMALYTNNIPFRYECELPLSSKTYYPDFTIRHPLTGKIYYWEHFGLMDNPEYYAKATSKLHNYISHGILPGLQLIITYETKENPLDIKEIERTIAQYFTQ